MTFSKEKKEYAVSLYCVADKSPSIASKLFKEKFQETISSTTLKRFWRQNNLGPNTHGGRRHGWRDDELIEFYQKHDGDFYEIIIDAKRCYDGLRERYKKLELKLKNTREARKHYLEKLLGRKKENINSELFERYRWPRYT